jgi:hypothetical protein
MTLGLLGLAALASTAMVCASSAFAQDADADLLELRITSTRPGAVIVDRGRVDGLAVGDPVLFRPREGFPFTGTVKQVDERSAVVELHDPNAAPALGVRGEVNVPRSRFAAPPQAAPEPAQQAPTAAPAHPPWKRTDDDWRPDQPLLAQVRALRPEQREARVTGLWYLIADQSWASEGHRTDGFFRTGVATSFENLHGAGETLRFDGELNYRHTDVLDDYDDEEAARLRLDRLSYSIGGTRYRPSRWDVGRFLQYGMPEFGVLDGVEWSRRTDGGDRYGASVGLMPEPDKDYDTGDDLQIAAHYRWIYDESEVFSIATGYQKSFHHGDADRDLAVATLAYLPPDGWSYQGTAWVDLYTGSDTAKGAGVELTQAIFGAHRYWESGNSANVTYTHMAFPEMDRDEFTPVTANQLANDHNDRVGLSGRRWIGPRAQLFAGIGGWIDEDDNGGDGELGVSIDELWIDRGMADAAIFGTLGRFNTSAGLRIAFGRWLENGSWRIGYEFAEHVLDESPSTGNQLPQHLLRASRDYHSPSGWSFSAHLDLHLWDDEGGVAGGFYLQKAF